MALEPAGLTWYNENLPGFVSDIGKANDAMASTGEAAERAGGGFSVLEGVVMGVASSFTTFVLDAVTRVSTAIIGLGKDSIDVAAQFQTMSVNMNYAGTQFKAAADAVGGFDEIALQVGADTRLVGVSATGAADAMTGLLKSGLSLTDVMGDTNAYMKDGAELGGALKASIDLAAASELDMVQASDLAVVVMSTFGKSAEEITGAMDYMVKTADASVAEVSDLSQALINIGPTAAAAGISFEDVNVALALLSTRGVKGAEAGTALKSVLANMRRPTKAVREELDKWGISVYDSTGAMYPLEQIIGQFQVALGGATQEEKDLAIQTIAGTYGMNAMNSLLGEGVEGWDAMAASIGNATSMSEKAAAQSQTYAGQLEAFNGVVETLRIRIGTALLPALTSIVGIFSDLIDRYGPAITAVFEKVGAVLGEFFGGLGTAIEGGWPEVGKYLEGWATKFWDWLTGPDGAISKASEMLGKVLTAIGDWLTTNWPSIQAKLLEWAGKFWDWLTGPGGATETGSGIFTTVADTISQWLTDNWPIISARLTEWAGLFWDWVTTEVVPKAMIKLTEISTAIREWAEKSETQATLSQTGETLGTALVDGLVLFVTVGKDWALVMSELGAALAQAAGEALLPAGILAAVAFTDGLAQGITGAVSGGKWKVGLDVKGIAEALGFSKTGKEAAEDMSKGFAKGNFEDEFKKTFGKAADGARNEMKDLSVGLVGHSIIPDMMQSMDRIISSSLKTILDTWSRAWTRIESIVRAGLSSILSVLQSSLKDFAERGRGIAESIASGISSAWSKVSAAVSDGISTILSSINSALSSLVRSGRDIAQSIASGIGAAWSSVTSAISNGMSAIGGAISSALSSVVQAGRSIATSIAGGISAAWNFVTSAISTGIAGIPGAINTALAAVVQAGRNIATSIANGISAAWSTVTTTLSTLAAGLAGAVVGVGSAIAASIVGGISSSLGFFWGGVTGVLSGLAGGLSTAIKWAEQVASAGAQIVNGIIAGVVANWARFVDWLKGAIAGIFGASEPTDPTSPFRSSKFFESGLRMGDAIAQGVQAGMSQGFAMPVTPYGYASPVGRSVSVSIGPITLGNQMDAEVFAQRVKQVVVGAF